MNRRARVGAVREGKMGEVSHVRDRHGRTGIRSCLDCRKRPKLNCVGSLPAGTPIPLRSHGPLAQLAEQLTLNQQVLGSSPRRVTRPCIQAVKDELCLGALERRRADLAEIALIVDEAIGGPPPGSWLPGRLPAAHRIYWCLRHTELQGPSERYCGTFGTLTGGAWRDTAVLLASRGKRKWDIGIRRLAKRAAEQCSGAAASSGLSFC